MAKKILIVDDETTVMDLLKLKLSKLDCELLEATNGKKGFEMAKEHKPDLIITDVVMPEMNGLDLYKEIRKTEELANIPVLVLTTRGLMEDCFLAVGVNSFLSKPVNTEQVLYKAFELAGIKLKDGSVPAMPAELGAAQPTAAGQEQAAQVQSQPKPAPLKKRKAVVFGYLEGVLQEMSVLLKELGCEATIVTQELDVINQAFSADPHLVLLQLNNSEQVGFLTDKIVFDLKTVLEKKTQKSAEDENAAPYKGFKVILYQVDIATKGAKIKPSVDLKELLERCLKEKFCQSIGPYQKSTFALKISEFLK